MKQIPKLDNLPKPIGPYSTAIISNSMLYVSGQIGISPMNSKLVSGGVEDEAIQILKNIDLILSSVGLNSSHVVMASIFLVKMSDFQAVNSIYAEWVNSALPPARQTIAVKELPIGAQVEISIIAEIVL